MMGGSGDMKGFVRGSRPFGGSVSRAFISTFVVLFLLSWSFHFAGPAAALDVYVPLDIQAGTGFISSSAYGISDLNQVVCYVELSYWESKAGIYDSGTGDWTLLPNPPSYIRGHGRAVNDLGEIAGYVANYNLTELPRIGAYWPSSYDRVITLDPLPGYAGSSATGMNDLHEAVGYIYDSLEPTDYSAFAAQWELDPDATSIQPMVLGSLAGMNHSYASDINNNHAIVGYAYNDTTNESRAFYCAGYGSALQPLPHLYEGPGGSWSVADAISDSGMIVGGSRDITGAYRAVAWLPPYSAAPVELIVGGVWSFASAVSDGLKIAGAVDLTPWTRVAFVYDYSTGACEYLEPPQTAVDWHATGVNDNGRVVGVYRIDYSYSRAVLWTRTFDTPPVAAFTAATLGLNVTVDASASYDLVGEIVDYSWSFGDGEYGSGMIVTHGYAVAGDYIVTLCVSDNQGQSDIVSLQVSVLDTAEVEAKAQELITMIDECTSIDPDAKDKLTNKASIALKMIGARKSHGNPAVTILLAFNDLVSDYVLTGEIASEYDAWNLTAQSNFIITLIAEDHIVGGVPVYTWYHGCGPTAAGMLLGYWDAKGFGELVKGPQGNEMYQSDEVNAMIASESHVEDYVYPLDGWVEQPDGSFVWVDLQPDKSELGGASDDDCIADFMHTSRSADGLVYGLSYVDMVDDALLGYASWASQGDYVGSAEVFHQSAMTWEILVSEVDATRPMFFVVDWDGDGETDHSVAVVGYCEVGKARLYAFHSTWDDRLWWAEFDMMKPGNFYGVFAGVTMSLSLA